MSDVIEALRAQEAPLLHEAADEIEQLREQLDFWRNKVLEKASKAMYAEMLKWSKQGYTVLQMQRDGENITFRPIA